MDGGVREKRGDVRQQGCGGVRVVRQGGGGGGAGSGAALVWLGVSASGVGAAPGGGTGVATGFSGNRLVRSGRGCWLNSPGSCWTPAASRCATCPRSPPSSTPRRRPSTGTCSSSDGGLNRGRKPGDDGGAVGPRSPGIKSGGATANAQVQAVMCRRVAIGVCGGGSPCGTRSLSGGWSWSSLACTVWSTRVLGLGVRTGVQAWRCRTRSGSRSSRMRSR